MATTGKKPDGTGGDSHLAPVFFRLLRGRANGAVEGAVADVVVTLIPLSAHRRGA